MVRRSYFTFQGMESGELPILGKSTLQRMAENLGAKLCDMPPAGEKAVLYPAYPFLTRKDLDAFLSKHAGSVRFAGGYVDRSGAFEDAEGFAGGLFCLEDYAAVKLRAERETCVFLRKNGVFAEDGAEIDCRAKIEAGAFIGRGSRISGACEIGANAQIFASEITESKIGAGTTVKNSVLNSCTVGSHSTVGPFAYLRPNANVGDCCRVGDFVEIKNANIGHGSKISHLAYVGDADVGERVNIGCGAVFVNYNGKKKFRSEVGSGAFIGSNCNLIAPVKVGSGAFVAAGTTLTQNLNESDFCIGRSRETIKPRLAEKYLK